MEVQEIFAILHKWGIHTLGQLAALDKEQLGARLGPGAIRMWERANGRSNRLLKLIRPPESFQESFEFEREIETAEPLLFMLRRFLEQLAVRLAAIYLVTKELTLRITFANSRQDEPAVAGKQSYERVFKIPQPTNDVDLLFRMLQTHLENFRSEHPIVAVALSAEPIKPAGEHPGRRSDRYTGSGRDASPRCISHAAVQMGHCRVRLVRRSPGEGGCPQRTIFRCAEDSAPYSSAAKISAGSVCVCLAG